MLITANCNNGTVATSGSAAMLCRCPRGGPSVHAASAVHFARFPHDGLIVSSLKGIAPRCACSVHHLQLSISEARKSDCFSFALWRARARGGVVAASVRPPVRCRDRQEAAISLHLCRSAYRRRTLKPTSDKLLSQQLAGEREGTVEVTVDGVEGTEERTGSCGTFLDVAVVRIFGPHAEQASQLQISSRRTRKTAIDYGPAQNGRGSSHRRPQW